MRYEVACKSESQFPALADSTARQTWLQAQHLTVRTPPRHPVERNIGDTFRVWLWRIVMLRTPSSDLTVKVAYPV